MELAKVHSTLTDDPNLIVNDVDIDSHTDETDDPNSRTLQILAAKALKKTVAIFEFANDSGYTSQANLGKDFSMQLQDALIQSGQFIVLTRKDLDVVMAEQDLAQSGRFAKSNSAKA